MLQWYGTCTFKKYIGDIFMIILLITGEKTPDNISFKWGLFQNIQLCIHATHVIIRQGMNIHIIIFIKKIILISK